MVHCLYQALFQPWGANVWVSVGYSERFYPWIRILYLAAVVVILLYLHLHADDYKLIFILSLHFRVHAYCVFHFLLQADSNTFANGRESPWRLARWRHWEPLAAEICGEPSPPCRAQRGWATAQSISAFRGSLQRVGTLRIYMCVFECAGHQRWSSKRRIVEDTVIASLVTRSAEPRHQGSCRMRPYRIGCSQERSGAADSHCVVQSHLLISLWRIAMLGRDGDQRFGRLKDDVSTAVTARAKVLGSAYKSVRGMK